MKFVLLLPVIVLISACASMPYEPYAREVKKKPRSGGVIALKPTHRPEDRARADFLMAANCGSDATANVAEEGEVVVGQKTDANSNTNKREGQSPKEAFRLAGISFTSGGTPPGEETTTSTETTQLKEWQIAYSCEANNRLPANSKKKISRN